MYPELFRIGDFSVSTFGLMLAVAFLVGSWIASIRMGEEGLEADSTTLLIYVMVGGIVGSKIFSWCSGAIPRPKSRTVM